MAKLFLTVFRSFETPLLSNFCLLYIIQKPPFCESSSPFLFDLSGEFSNQDLTARWKYCFRTSFQNINSLGWHHCFNFVIIEDVLRRKPRFLIMHRVKRVKSFQPPCGFGVRNFYRSQGSPWPILTRERRFLCKPKNLCFVFAAIGSPSPLRSTCSCADIIRSMCESLTHARLARWPGEEPFASWWPFICRFTVVGC